MAKDVDDSKCSDDGKLLRQPVFVFRAEQGDLMTTTTLMLLLLLLLMLLVFPIFATFSHSSSASGAVTTVCDLTRSPTHLCIRTKLQFPLRLMKNVSRATPPISRGVELRCDGSPVCSPSFTIFPARQIMSSIEFQTIILARSQIAAKIFATPAVRCQQFPISGCWFCMSSVSLHNTFRLRIQIKLLSWRSHPKAKANV